MSPRGQTSVGVRISRLIATGFGGAKRLVKSNLLPMVPEWSQGPRVRGFTGEGHLESHDEVEDMEETEQVDPWGL